MPNPNHTPTRSFRFPPGLYASAREIAERRGETMTDVLTEALTKYVRRNTPKDGKR